MECGLCEIRGAVGFCVECRRMVCEVCGIPCKHCGKMVCGEHVKITRSGKRLCGTCYAERQARKNEARRQVEA